MEPLTWSTSIQAAEWLGRALNEARNKRQQQFARLVEHVGTITAGLRGLDREAHRLFLPIIYGDIRTWPESQRLDWKRNIVAFAHEDKITTAVRVSLEALRALELQQSDRDLGRLLQDLIELLDWHPGDFFWGPTGILLQANVTGYYDFLIGTELDDILEALDSPQSADIDRVRWVVAQFVYGDATLRHSSWIRYRREELYPRAGHLYKQVTVPKQRPENEPEELMGPGEANAVVEYPLLTTANYISTLRPYADKAEEILGGILAL